MKKKKYQDETQEVINALVFKYGANFINQPNAKAWCEEVKLDPDLVTTERLREADAQVRGIAMEVVHAPPPKQVREDLINWLSPVTESFESDQSTFHIWATECGRYRIGRVIGAESRFTAMRREEGKRTEIIVKDDLQSLRAALNAIEKYHNFKYNRDSTKSNRETVIRYAEEEGLYELTNDPLVPKIDLSILDQPAEEKPKKKRDPTLNQSKDKFGSSPNSVPGKINEAITDEWRPVEEIVDSCKIPRARVKTHLNWLLGLGKVEQTGNRWRIKQND